jgi:ABC-type transport system involved in cytochrome c biogenesis ATPase subunit
VDWFKRLASLYQKLQLGAADSSSELSNIVYVPSEARQILEAPSFGKDTVEAESLYGWLTQYDGIGFLSAGYKGHIEGMLRNLKVRDPNWFYGTLKNINILLSQNGRRLTDFDRNLRMMVEAEGHPPYYVDKLSSGEQQCLILIFMISRWLMDGGIVLIDEPDLHMHVSWQRQLIHELERLVNEKNGQLIVTSHSPTLWEEYNERQRINFEVAVQP